jgi:hypothetical protein
MRIVLVCALLGLAGCATLTEGQRQDVTILISPANATCEAKRDTYSYGAFSGPRKVLNVAKTQKELTITCSAPGYKTAVSETRGTPSKMAVAGAVVTSASLAVDMISGSAFKLPETITITLERAR